MDDLAYPLAIAIVVAVPLAAIGLLALATWWATWVLRVGGRTGRIGMWATWAAVVAGVLWATLDADRSVRTGLAVAEAAGLVALVTSLVVARGIRRSGLAGAAAAPAAPFR